MIKLPTIEGWMVSWYTGEVKEIKYKNGSVKVVRCKDSFESRSKERVMQKKDELEQQGYEIEYVTECIF